MATPNIPPRLVPPTTSYWDYLTCTDTNTFSGRYTAVLATYDIDAAAAAEDDVAHMIYAAYQEISLAAFLKYN